MAIRSSAKHSANSSDEASFLETKEEGERLQGIASFLLKEYEACKNARTSIEKEWYENLAFYLGNQWSVWGRNGSALGGKLVTPGAPPWRTRLTVNRIQPIIRTELSRVTSTKPSASVAPASSEDEDLFAAQAAEQVWDSVYREKNIHRSFSRAAFWMLITGCGYLKDYWDPSKRDRTNKMDGDIHVESVTPWHIFVPDLTLEEIEDQPYVIHSKVVPINQIYRMYPELKGKVKPSVVSENEIMENTKLKIGTNNAPDSTLMLEFWIKPGFHEAFPQGGMVTIVDTFIVQYTEPEAGWPYEHEEYPFIKFDHIPTGKYYADSVIVALRALQREYNRTRSQVVEAKNRMAKPQLTAVEGSVDPHKITSEPGQVIFYKAGFNPPTPLPLQGLPAYVLQELDRIVLDMEDISAQHQVSKGNVPPGVTAATAISYLQEKDDSVLSHTYASIEQGMEKLGRQILSYVVQFWDVPRIIKVTGVDGAFDAVTLKGSEISNGTDLRVEGGSSLPTSKAARQALIMDLMKMGFIPPEKGLEIMEIGGVQKLYEQLRVDERQAQRENLRMKSLDPQAIAQHEQMRSQFDQMVAASQEDAMMQQEIIPPELPELAAPTEEPGNLPFASGERQPIPEGAETDPTTGAPLAPPPLVPVNTWDNHAVHIDVHNRFRKGQAFELLSEEHKALFEEHVRMHADALNQSAMQAQMMGDPSGGMGVPPLDQGAGGEMPPELQQMMEGQ